MKYTDEYLAKAGKLTTMGNVAEKFAKLTETQVTKPINLSELEARITNLEATAKKWEIVTIKYQTGSRKFIVPEKYRGWNFAVISWYFKVYGSGGSEPSISISNGGRDVSVKEINRVWGISLKYDGSTIKFNGAPRECRDLTVLFYK